MENYAGGKTERAGLPTIPCRNMRRGGPAAPPGGLAGQMSERLANGGANPSDSEGERGRPLTQPHPSGADGGF